MSDLTRREMLGVLAVAPLVTAFDGPASLGPSTLERAAAHASRAIQQATSEPEIFSPYEWRMVRILAETLIPADGEHGGALEAGVPEFIDFTIKDRPQLRVPVRAGLRWLDTETRRRTGTAFADATTEQQHAVIDDIAWPARAHPDMAAGVTFFNQFRDLVASGYFSSRVGVEYLQYMGNRVVREWHGCPDEALQKLGVSYGD
ncbi:gluconate 2-dehydrogenase subunit 3 family protein [soil metagenome]